MSAGTTKRYRILTTYSLDTLETQSLAEFPHLEFIHRGCPRRMAALVVFAARSMWRADFDGVLVEGGYEGTIFALFKRLFFRRDKILVANIMFLNKLPAKPVQRLIAATKLRVLRAGVDCHTVLSTDEIESYSNLIGIDTHSIKFINFKYNSNDYINGLETCEGSFIYAGGDSLRDYETLFKAVEPLPIQVRILTHIRFPAGLVPTNVEIVENGNTIEEFFEPCARSLFAVFPFRQGFLRSTGHASYLGAMALGKAVIVSDTPGVRDFIDDGTTGLVCPPGDVLALRAAIETLINDGDLRRRLGAEARRAVLGKLTHDAYFRQIFAILTDLFQARDGSLQRVGGRDV